MAIVLFIIGAALVVTGAAFWFGTGAALVAGGVLAIGAARDLSSP